MELSLAIHTPNSVEKKTEIIDTAEKNYKISRHVYQCIFVDLAESFIEYIHSLDEIQQLDDYLNPLSGNL